MRLTVTLAAVAALAALAALPAPADAGSQVCHEAVCFRAYGSDSGSGSCEAPAPAYASSRTVALNVQDGRSNSTLYASNGCYGSDSGATRGEGSFLRAGLARYDGSRREHSSAGVAWESYEQTGPGAVGAACSLRVFERGVASTPDGDVPLPCPPVPPPALLHLVFLP